MTSRYITATFANGAMITRTTTNPNLAWAWKASGNYKGKHAIGGSGAGSNSGFSSTQHLAEKEARKHSKYWPIDFTFEVVKAVEAPKPKRVR
jgi:hypothetical protein